MFVARCSSTMMAPLSIASPLPSRKAVAGRTPRARMTRSALRTPLSVRTLLTAASPSSASSLVDVETFIEAFSSWRRARLAISKSKARGMIWSAMSTTVTSRPSAIRFSATSRPMKPAPTTTARLTSSRLAQALIASASSGVLNVKTPSSSTPGTGGTMGVAPVAMTSLS